MGVIFESRAASEEERKREEDEKHINDARASIDCKSTALGLCLFDPLLKVNRGFAVWRDGKAGEKFPVGGFTEHWWCVSRTGLIVDITSLRTILGCVPEYVSLEAGPLISLCNASDGPCETRPICAWCVTRKKLVSSGLSRIRLYELDHRPMLDKLFADKVRLKSELARELIEKGRDVITCNRCYSKSRFNRDLGGYAPIEHTEDCPLS